MSGPRTVLVVVAHSDDEALGCGATLRRHADQGDAVFALSLTDGVGARGDDPDAARRRADAAQASAQALGFSWLPAGSFPDNALDSVPLIDVVQFIEAAAAPLQPDLVYTHHAGDLNVDHQRVGQAVLTAFRPQPGRSVREIRTFEVASSTEWSHRSVSAPFQPNLYVDATAAWPAKEAALTAYAEELRPAPHARSLEGLDALARLRGAQVGYPRAEAFCVLRRLVAAGDAL